MSRRKRSDKHKKTDRRDNRDRMGRQEILAALAAAGRPVSEEDLARELGLDDSSRGQLPGLMERLHAKGQVIRTRKGHWGLAERMDLIRGRVSAHPDGFGFVMPDEDGDDLYLSPRQMRQVMHNDRVLASVVRVDRRGRREGAVVEILERANQHVVGRFLSTRGVAMVVPDDPKLQHDVVIESGNHGAAGPGEIVVAEITGQPGLDHPPVGRIVRVLGRADAPGIATEVAIYSHDLPAEFAQAVIDEAESFGDRIDPAELEHRRDLRALPLCTIDGADARDFDDAVYCEAAGDGGWRLVVAIADVAAYVRHGSALDESAYERGTSVYFPNRVLPMLPEALSNGLCSLNPEVERLALVCEMRVDGKGRVKGSEFDTAVIRSHARLTYTEVDRILKGDAGLRKQCHDGVLDSLQAFHELWQALLRNKHRRGALDFDTTEARFVFDAEGHVQDIVPAERRNPHRMIEEAMIAANVEAARFLERHELPGLYRVHPPPGSDKLDDLETFLLARGLKPTWREQPEPREFAAILDQVGDRPDRELIQTMLLRAQNLAVYRPKNEGHFGLALEEYTHFTSPIRRYPDLVVHRAIRSRIAVNKAHDPDQLAEIGQRCSMTERRAEEASRDVEQRLKCVYMSEHIGETFDGLVSGVTSFGIFVELQGNKVSGLVHISNLPGDYYHFDAAHQELVGKHTGRRFQIADPVRVQVVRVDVQERKVDFELVD